MSSTAPHAPLRGRPKLHVEGDVLHADSTLEALESLLGEAPAAAPGPEAPEFFFGADSFASVVAARGGIRTVVPAAESVASVVFVPGESVVLPNLAELGDGALPGPPLDKGNSTTPSAEGGAFAVAFVPGESVVVLNRAELEDGPLVEPPPDKGNPTTPSAEGGDAITACKISDVTPGS